MEKLLINIYKYLGFKFYSYFINALYNNFEKLFFILFLLR